MRCVTTHATVFASCLALSVQAMAWENETSAMLGAGGLKFEQTDKLRMEREELYLSPREIRVTYTIRNLTDQDVRSGVAFPTPEINVGDMNETPHKFHKSGREGDVFDFDIEVNGATVAGTYDARAIIKAADGSERDVTDLLRKHKVPLIDPDQDLLDGKVTDELVAAEIFVNGGHGPDTFERPAWSLRATYNWTQVFLPRQETRITLRYKPVLGAADYSTAYDGDINDPKKFNGEWCPDDAFARAARKLPATNPAKYVRLGQLGYFLASGPKWTGPVGTFRLEIDKAGADLVSLCPVPGLRLQRRGESYVAESVDYTLATDIKLLFVYRACDKAPCGMHGDWPGYPR